MIHNPQLESRVKPFFWQSKTYSATLARNAEALALRAQLSRPLGSRAPVSYERAFVDDYIPNESSLIPSTLADDLYAAGRAQGQQPAGTVARKVLEARRIPSAPATASRLGRRSDA